MGDSERVLPGGKVMRSANERTGAIALSKGFRRPADGPEGIDIRRIG
jgi:hypothetical protein